MNEQFSPDSGDFGSVTSFRETQRMTQWWLWLLLGSVAASTWWGLFQQILLGKPFGNNPAPDWTMWLLWFFIGLLMPIGFWMMKLIVEVRLDHLYIRFVPFATREITFSEIASCQARRYAPIREYGGWGVRGMKSMKKMAYSAKGNQGVAVELKDGRKVMIGSQKANELERALSAAIQA
jgi:hypothetical protein